MSSDPQCYVSNYVITHWVLVITWMTNNDKKLKMFESITQKLLSFITKKCHSTSGQQKNLLIQKFWKTEIATDENKLKLFENNFRQ